jgi:hypothetical protein
VKQAVLKSDFSVGTGIFSTVFVFAATFQLQSAATCEAISKTYCLGCAGPTKRFVQENR